ncbi:MAG: hypothetical protein LBJ02_12020 [Bifidobacteriaceae bacterium]|nr:hypothetical protein [Bifidobacteriaceae bacterium]
MVGATAGVLVLLAVGLPNLKPKPVPDPPPSALIVYVAPGATDSAYVIPGELRDRLYAAAAEGRELEVIRVEADARSTVATVDLTAYVEGGKEGEVELRADKVQERAEAKLVQVEADMNRATPGTAGRATYLGLVEAHPSSLVEDTPVWVFSSFLDTEDPTDARAMAWKDGLIQQVVDTASETEFVPTWMKGHPATYVRTAPAGQQNLYPAEEAYLKSLHGALAKNAGVESLAWIDMAALDPTSDEPIPVVPVGGVPPTPVGVEVNPENGNTTCTVSVTARFSLVNHPSEVTLLDRPQLAADLAECAGHIGPGAEVNVDGYSAWPGAVDSAGRPVDNPANSVAISDARARLVAQVLEEDLGVPDGQTEATGHGNAGAPYPEDPAAAENAVVIITIIQT